MQPGIKEQEYIVNKKLVIPASAAALIIAGVSYLAGYAMLGLGAAFGVIISLINNRVLEWSIYRILGRGSRNGKFLVVLSYYLRLTVICLILLLIFPLTGTMFVIGFIVGLGMLKALILFKQIKRFQQEKNNVT